MFNIKKGINMEEYREIIDHVKMYGNWFRLGTTFRTKEEMFFLDSGTGKVFKVNEHVFRVLNVYSRQIILIICIK